MELKDELLNDPRSLGYAPFVTKGSDGRLAQLLNEVRPEIIIRRASVDPATIFAAIAVEEMPKSDEGRAWLAALGNQKTLFVTPEAEANLLALFPDGTKTHASIEAVLNRPGSRMEELAGDGARVEHPEISAVFAVEREARYQQEQAPLDAAKRDEDTALKALLATREGAGDVAKAMSNYKAAKAAVEAVRKGMA